MELRIDTLEVFKTVAARVDQRAFAGVTRQSALNDLGIDSLSMMQIVGEMEDELGVVVADEDLVAVATVGDLCSKVEAKVAAAAGFGGHAARVVGRA
jgi:acyl carrier protein